MLPNYPKCNVIIEKYNKLQQSYNQMTPARDPRQGPFATGLRNHERGVNDEESWRRNHWRSNHREEIIEEESLAGES